MFKVEFDEEVLRKIVREEVQQAVKEHVKTIELPPLLTRTQLMDLLHIRPTKTSELLARADFPVLREAGGVLIPTQALFTWIESHTEWVQSNTQYYRSVI
ncbi:hypothetical protein [Kurthia sp. Dielmo]|uniref:hypothetical protein n=1 Tax=Kurthia sp. Dielmo TaxID=1033738 RepID=UPI0003169176|nr:hypothetical protein [Kurthia sp. Dielmo]